MTRPLSDTQRVILAHAAARDDGRIFPTPRTLTKNSGAITLSLRPLVASGMVSEISANLEDTSWGQTADGAPTTLVVTELGMAAIGAQSTLSVEDGPTPAPVRTVRQPSATSKLGVLIASLGRPNGATLDELVTATGWQKHSVRGAISGALKVKHHLNVQSTVVEGRGRVYRIVKDPTAASDKDEVVLVGNEAAAQS